MGSLIGIAAGAWLAWNFGQPWQMAFLGDWWWAGTAGIFMTGYLVARGVVTVIALRFVLSGGGLWSSAVGRRLIGLFADSCIKFLQLLVTIYLCIRLDIYSRMIANAAHHMDVPELVGSYVLMTGLIFLTVQFCTRPLVRPFKIMVGKASRPFRRLWRSLIVGVGGSSNFAGLLEEWANPWRQGKVFLGASLYDPKWQVGVHDDRHFLTIATSRSGKGRSAIIPNLLTWPGSALIIDPKGENAAVTAKRRRELGQTIRIVDPFGVLKDMGLTDSTAYPILRFNPLAEVDLNSLNVVEQIREITEAMVLSVSKTNPFFDDAAKKIITGVIAHVLSHHSIKDEDKHLGTVRDFLVSANGRDITQLASNNALGGLAAAAAHALRTGSEGAAGDVLFTAQIHTEWLDSLAMRHCMSGSDFTLKDLKDNSVSLYLILPAQLIEIHARFLRLFVNLAIRVASTGAKARHPVLFLLDEFYSLGTLPILASASGQVAGFGVKLWPICQNIGQLQSRYGEGWETFVGNAGMLQVFAVNDQTTGRYMSERLGHHISWRKMRTQLGTEWVPQGATWLRTSVEFARDSSRDSGNQVVFREGDDAFLLRRSPYDWTFKSSQYSPNPYEPNATPAYGSWSDRMDARWRAWVKRRFNIDLDAMERTTPPDQDTAANATPPQAHVQPDIPQTTTGDLDRRVTPLRRADGIDWSKMGQSSQRASGNGAVPSQEAGNGVTQAGQGRAAPPQPVQPVAPRQTNGDGIDWRSIEAEWDLVPASQQAERAPTQTDAQEPGLRPPPPLKPARRKRTQP